VQELEGLAAYADAGRRPSLCLTLPCAGAASTSWRTGGGGGRPARGGADMEQLQRDKAAALGAVQRLEVGAAASAASLAAARSQVPNLPYFNPRCPAAALLAPCRRQKISALLLISVNADCDAQL